MQNIMYLIQSPPIEGSLNELIKGHVHTEFDPSKWFDDQTVHCFKSPFKYLLCEKTI